MKLPDDSDDRRETIAEQWWVGIVCMLFWAAAIFIFIKSCAHGAEVALSWNQPPSGPLVSQWKIYRVSPLPRTQIGVAETNHAMVTANDGDRLVITACSANEESADSAVWIVRLPSPNPVARVTMEASADLKAWESFQAFDIPSSQAKFFRLKIEPAP